MTSRMAGRHWALAIFTAAALLFILAPVLIVVINSFNGVAYSVFPPKGFSLQWYANLAKQTSFYGAAVRSVVVAVLSTILAVIAGTMASIVLIRHKLVGANLIKSFFLSPIVLPKMVLGVALFMLFIRIGLFGGLTGLVISHALVSLPFVMAIVSANLQGLDITLEEAAMDLGAGPLRTFFKVVLPQIRVGLMVSALFAFIISFDQVETSLFLVRGDNTTLPIEMYLYLEKWQDPTIAALSTLLILFSVVLVVLLGMGLKKVDVVDVFGSGKKNREGSQ
ncbi:MAG: spermidine/putrescine transporter permease [Firmicutes bacterium]|nr:spermidine/putrescine transporter permease [Bacillota bacterium]